MTILTRITKFDGLLPATKYQAVQNLIRPTSYVDSLRSAASVALVNMPHNALELSQNQHHSSCNRQWPNNDLFRTRYSFFVEM